MNELLPIGFDALVQFGPKWFANTEKERHQYRLESNPDELNQLYDAILPRFDEIVTELDQYPLDDLPESHRNLLNLTLSFMEVSMAVESFKGAAKVPFGFDPARWEVHF
ncbi:MAG: hypothetical protein JKY89_00465 [Immundisolibacteraceae bacterium]|nr:hypothetical protein [Immundisolibacteraceae bacterium]